MSCLLTLYTAVMSFEILFPFGSDFGPFGYTFTALMDVSAKLAALTSALGPYGHVRPGRAAETPGFAFYGAIGILVCD